jgi:hypothetical protein
LGIFQGENNQHVDLGEYQVMQFIVCDNEIVGIKILALHTRCTKVAYHKANCISTMKKHVEQDHINLF